MGVGYDRGQLRKIGINTPAIIEKDEYAENIPKLEGALLLQCALGFH